MLKAIGSLENKNCDRVACMGLKGPRWRGRKHKKSNLELIICPGTSTIGTEKWSHLVEHTELA